MRKEAAFYGTVPQFSKTDTRSTQNTYSLSARQESTSRIESKGANHSTENSITVSCHCCLLTEHGTLSAITEHHTGCIFCGAVFSEGDIRGGLKC
jgi:hypothetical protein